MAALAPSGPSPALACLGLVRGGSVDQREAALASLAAMLSSEDASDEAIVQVNELICSTAGCLEEVCGFLHASASASAKQSALVVLRAR